MPRTGRQHANLEAEPGWLEHLLDATASAIVALDSDGRVLYWNAAAERLFGWPRAEVLGKRLPIVPPALQQEWQLQMQHVLAEGQSTPAAETQRITRDGRLVPVLRSSAPLRGTDGRPVGLVDTLTDISAHKQLDEESRALVRVRERELIAMDLHDGLSQSLYSVVLSLAAAERNTRPDSSATLHSVLGEARRQIERVVEETRSYLRDLGVREVAPPDLAAGLQLLVDSLRLNGGLQASLELDPAVPPLLGAEVRRHVLYLVREAASNVVRHAQAQHVQLSLQHDRAACSVVVSVRDDGRGFELPAPDQTAGAGPGHHGLRTMAERAHLIGGQLSLSSQPGRGTAVRLEVPLASGLGGVQPPPAAADPQRGARGSASPARRCAQRSR